MDIHQISELWKDLPAEKQVFLAAFIIALKNDDTDNLRILFDELLNVYANKIYGISAETLERDIAEAEEDEKEGRLINLEDLLAEVKTWKKDMK
jgi:hypothetical protein